MFRMFAPTGKTVTRKIPGYIEPTLRLVGYAAQIGITLAASYASKQASTQTEALSTSHDEDDNNKRKRFSP
jgi:hypothetical protein